MADVKKKMGIYDQDDPRANRINIAREENPSDKYGSIREYGTENRLKRRKKEALGDLAFGVAASPVLTPLDALTRDIPNPSGPMGSGLDYVRTRPDATSKALKDASDYIGGAASRYKSAKGAEESLNRELESQMKRETRGMKKGGKVKKMASGGKTSSASSRADGCAQRGKTKGRMI